MGVLGLRSRDLLPTDWLRRRADGAGAGAGVVRASWWLPGRAAELGLEVEVVVVVLVGEETVQGWPETRARLH